MLGSQASMLNVNHRYQKTKTQNECDPTTIDSRASMGCDIHTQIVENVRIMDYFYPIGGNFHLYVVWEFTPLGWTINNEGKWLQIVLSLYPPIYYRVWTSWIQYPHPSTALCCRGLWCTRMGLWFLLSVYSFCQFIGATWWGKIVR